MKVSIIVCTTGRKTLENCLKSLDNQSIDSEKIIVSHKDIKNRIKKFEGFKFVKTKLQSLSEDRNRGIKESNGDIVAFIDDDAEADEKWLENLTKHYKDEEVAAVGGKITPEYTSKVPSNILKLDKHIKYGLLGCTFINWNKAGELNSPLLWGCNISFRKKIFEDVGHFPSELGRRPGKLLGEEERYLQLEILNKNYKIIYEPNSEVEHIIDENQLTEDHFIEKSFWQGVSEIKRLKLSSEFIENSADKEQLFKISKYELTRQKFKLEGLSDLKEKIDTARELGRLSEITKILKD